MDLGFLPDPSIADCAPPWPLRVVYRVNVACSATRPQSSRTHPANRPLRKANTAHAFFLNRFASAHSARRFAAAACVRVFRRPPP